ncbi:hypothetical protein MYK68_14170 [Gordonia sp. PP30]|uniref:hypothetical protein n=1 Tax=Gordonia sp. PP30 TaxID=2935861 RepID=UPI001FFE2F28|nr:hypothetical protein [Gordonia sp. PP30]UQE73877.1 hypothetical protein MYK68_14170 [Gordonia sp. PP30]
MSEQHTTFVDACLANQARPTDIDDWVDRWHDGEGPELSLDDFLGFTADEAQRALRATSTVEAIIESRRARAIHLILTDYGDGNGWSVRSPQVPIVGGRPTSEQLLGELTAMLLGAGVDITGLDDPRLVLHEEHVAVDPCGAPYRIRWRIGEGESARIEAANRLNTGVIYGWGEYRDREPVLPTGERLLIAVTSTDTLADIEDQLPRRGGCASVAQHLGDDALVTVPFHDSTIGTTDRRFTFDELGLSPESTFGAIVEAVTTAELGDLVQEMKSIDSYTPVIPGQRRFVS